MKYSIKLILLIALFTMACEQKPKQVVVDTPATEGDQTLTLTASQMRYVKIDTVKEVKAAA